MGEYFSFIGIDFWTALFTLLNFLAVFFMGKRYLWGPVTKMIADRQKEIDDMYAEADTARTSAKALEEEYEAKLSVAAQTSEKLVREAVARGQAREEEILRNANQRAEAMLEKASADIQQEKKKALNDAKDEISELALSIAAKVVNRELTEEDHQRLVEQFIEDLGESL